MRSRIALLLAAGLLTAGPGSGTDPTQVVEPGHPAARADFTAYCRSCHDCEAPTRQEPCLGVCPRHGGHFFGEHLADEGPEILVIDQLAEHYQPVVFSHSLHAGMSAMSGGCTNCHHYSERSGQIPPCRECHAVSSLGGDLRRPALKGAYHRQCIGCHRDWAHENACGFCHKPANGPPPAEISAGGADILGTSHPPIVAEPRYVYETPEPSGAVVTFHHEDHVEKFGLECVDCHRGDSCGRCHDESAPRRQLSHVETCGSCHVERDCTFCHSGESKPPFDHSTTVGWPLDPYHGELACQDCHGQPQTFRYPSADCRSCHIHWETGAFDHTVTGFVLDEMHREFDCGDCHQDQRRFRNPTCSACHDDQVPPR